MKDTRVGSWELVAKAFARGAGVEVGRQQRVDALALSADELALAKSLGVDPAQTLVTPGSLAEDGALAVVATDF